MACEIGKWTHLALVCERGKSQLSINGMPVGENASMHFPLCLMDALPTGGNFEHPQHGFSGEIDEVRLSTFIGPFRPSNCYCFARLSCRNENRENIKDVCCTDELFQPQEEFFGGRGAKCLT